MQLFAMWGWLSAQSSEQTNIARQLFRAFQDRQKDFCSVQGASGQLPVDHWVIDGAQMLLKIVFVKFTIVLYVKMLVRHKRF